MRNETYKERIPRIWANTAVFLTLFLAIWSGHLSALNLTSGQQAAKDRGIALFNQYRIGGPYLHIAAEAGDADAQFYLGEEIRELNRFITRESQKWLEAAANQGHIYAMIRLGRSGNDLCAVMGNCPSGSKSPGDWLRHAYQVALPLAEQGDPEAMYLMYEITLDTDWRAKAAEAGYAQAQYDEAVSIDQGRGFYLFRSREEAAVRWYKASAEGGYPLSMEIYQNILAKKGDWEGVRYWHYKAAGIGYVFGVYTLGSHLSHEPEGYGHEMDLIKGYGLLSLLPELDGGGQYGRYASEKLPLVAAKMTPEQIEQALEFALEWKATHPPVSYFPDKLSIY